MIDQKMLIVEFRAKRAELGLTQSETAKRIGISRQQLSKIDNGCVKLLHVKTSDAIRQFIESEERQK